MNKAIFHCCFLREKTVETKYIKTVNISIAYQILFRTKEAKELNNILKLQYMLHYPPIHLLVSNKY